MKGKIVQQQVCDSALEWTHGFSYTIKRIIVPEANNLVITPHKGQIYVFTGLKGDHEEIAEVDVPDELVNKALAFHHAKVEFNLLRNKFEALIGSKD